VSAGRAAVAAYERALALGEDAEIHYRAFLAAYYVDFQKDGVICTTCRDGYEAVIRHADAVRRIDPQTPWARELAWRTCASLSKLGGLGGPDADAELERGIREYDTWRTLTDQVGTNALRNVSISYSNEAELYMALGRLDEAIDYYTRAVETDGTESLNFFGLAVALDRDGQSRKARAAMRTAITFNSEGIGRLTLPDVFFVPQGDLYYY